MRFLDGITILDLSQILTGPLASMHLGDMGAEVVKIERPGRGDLIRELGPHVDGVSSQYMAVNRNKRSIAIDLTATAGQEIVLELAEGADVFIENFKLGNAERLGLDYETINETNPDIIYCSIKGFAKGSVYEDNAAYDMVAQAMSGSMSLTGPVDGPPMYTPNPIGDLAAAMYALQAILGALFDREFNESGGEFIEVPMLDCVMAWMGLRLAASGSTGKPYPRIGNQHPNIAPYKVFETADSYIVVAVASEGFWAPFCQAIGRDDLIDDPRFVTNDDRKDNQAELYGILGEIMNEKSTDDWFEIFRDRGVPAGPVRDTIEVLNDTYTTERSLVEDLTNDGFDGSIPVVRYPVDFATASAVDPIEPRPLGADTEQYLRTLGYTDSEINALRNDDVIACAENGTSAVDGRDTY